MNFSLFGVLSEYAFHSESTALADTGGCCFATVLGGAIGQITVKCGAGNFGRGGLVAGVTIAGVTSRKRLSFR